MYAEVCNGQEFVSFSVQKPMENPIVAGRKEKKSQGQKRRERRKRMKDKLKSEEKEQVKGQEVIIQEDVSTDAEASEEVFIEDLETGDINPRTRIRVRSRQLVLSVGGGEAVARPSNPDKIIEQLDGVNEVDKDESIDDGNEANETSEDDKIIGNNEATVTYDLTISAHQLVDAYCSIEDNLCHSKEDSENIPFISETPSSEVMDLDGENTLFTLEIQIINEESFLKKVLQQFNTWDPLYFKKPRGKLVEVMKRN